MGEFLLDNVFWCATAVIAFAGLLWTFFAGVKINLSPQAAILTVTRNNGVFLDIRSPEEFSTGHIPRSQNISGELANRLSSIAKFKEKPVVVVCPNGMRARKTAQQLIKEGYSRVHVLAGGLNAWRDANLPLFNKKERK